MSETEEFLAAVMPRLTEAEIAVHNGKVDQRIAMWSHEDPTVFGAGMSGRGWDQVEALFHKLGTRMSDCTSYEIRVVHAYASGDLAYLVAFEHTSASINGVPMSYILRVTTIFRREDGEWKAVHRHGDQLATETAANLIAEIAGTSR